MKTQTNSLFSQLSKTQLISLTSEVKETLAMHISMHSSKKITAADVWNIQRHKRTMVKRRFVL